MNCTCTQVDCCLVEHTCKSHMDEHTSAWAEYLFPVDRGLNYVLFLQVLLHNSSTNFLQYICLLESNTSQYICCLKDFRQAAYTRRNKIFFSSKNSLSCDGGESTRVNDKIDGVWIPCSSYCHGFLEHLNKNRHAANAVSNTVLSLLWQVTKPAVKKACHRSSADKQQGHVTKHASWKHSCGILNDND